MKERLVSIILATHNNEGYIRKTLDSIQAQTYALWELEVTDDASTDSTAEIIGEYAYSDSRIHLHRLNVNVGAGMARNHSLEKATGELIAFIDSDDWWYPSKLEKQLTFMAENAYPFSFTNFEYCNADLSPMSVSVKPRFVSYKDLKIGCDVNIPGVIYDSAVTGKIYFPDMRKRQDWVMLINLAHITGGAHSIDEVLWKCRRRPDSLSADKLSLIPYNLEVYRKHLGYSSLKSLVVFVFKFIPFQVRKRLRLKKIRIKV